MLNKIYKIIKLSLTIILYSTLFIYCISPYRFATVKGNSMQPTITPGSIVLYQKLPDIQTQTNQNKYKTFKVGEVVGLKVRGQYILKRVIATEGMVVEAKNSKLYVDGKAIRILEVKTDWKEKVKPNHLYLLGDNIYNSIDSRELGQIKVEDVKYKIKYLIYKAKPMENKQETR